jgi:redox-sensitive bicupin YhaK (pirin superfamily)
MNTPRTVQTIIEPQLVIEGAGVLLRRSIAPQVSNEFDPFLLFDHFAFNDPKEGPIRGFPMHPHRGIETVTYMLDGSVNHRDSLGNSGLIGPGEVQWMTSGRGIMHEEMPRRGPSGSIAGFQLWVNLPAAQKMSQPRYQEVNAAAIPVIEQNGARIRLVAGAVSDHHGPVTDIAAQPVYLEAQLGQGAEFSHLVPLGHTTLVYLFAGALTIEGQAIDATHMIVLADGDLVRVTAGPQGARFMLIAGEPFGEPIAPYGPFVMNTRAEIQQALSDLRNGTFVK